MAKKSKMYRLSTLLNMSTVAIDTYNKFSYRSENKKLNIASVAVSTVSSIVDFYLAIKSPRKLTKIVTLASAGISVTRNVLYLINQRRGYNA
ncbi:MULTISPECIES: hypothetical protein [Staphylococcus]|uniref:Uncharacterized protein n=1 Tax=Staphylococcus pettenkoferi TaxID=170573 RepID=A0A2N6QBE4_9STAP|nr:MULTISPECIES: hypothetical protein [Staphylococcus]MBX8994506.1 hypothetical protein [Staphylococcus pettenkoferi]MCI2792499.1 hypothetical protein [Staphylococcus pettenkoferi]MCY1567579.1 hypothetical protein [Staphylococcus pettenkoferi]MCY1587277.1 hypothetical protein [Staphylococcus pettenkoferi]MCY1605070.1 hypothetical protein [Staphylococcus pettenkoferi]